MAGVKATFSSCHSLSNDMPNHCQVRDQFQFPLKQIVSACLALWFGIWLLFQVRSAISPENPFRKIRTLCWMGFGERRSFIYGKEFSDFMSFCREKIPANGTFLFLGPDDQAVSRPRAYLELLPCLPNDHPEFLIVYKSQANIPPSQGDPFASFSPDSFILKQKDRQP